MFYALSKWLRQYSIGAQLLFWLFWIFLISDILSIQGMISTNNYDIETIFVTIVIIISTFIPLLFFIRLKRKQDVTNVVKLHAYNELILYDNYVNCSYNKFNKIYKKYIKHNKGNIVTLESFIEFVRNNKERV